MHFKLFSLVLVLILAQSAFSRNSLNFNSGWDLHVGGPEEAGVPEFDNSSRKKITLPRAWNEDEAFRVDIAELPTGTAWYRKSFFLPSREEGGRVFVEFEGVRQGAEFFINDHSLGFHEDGITAVGYDLTPHLKDGENTIAVRTNNAWDYRERETRQRYQWNDRNFNANYGGITKNVKLHVTGAVYQTLPLWNGLGTTGVYIHASGFDLSAGRATVHAESQVKNESSKSQSVSYAVVVSELDGREIAKFNAGEAVVINPGETKTVFATAPVSGLQWWSWGHGYLYNVTTTLLLDGKAVDVVNTRTGFRKTTFTDGMVALNGRVLQLKGYAQRTTNEWPAVGNCVPPWLSDFSNGLMVESGANLVRWMHTCPSKQDVESCDRVGLMQAMPAGDAEHDVTGRRWEQRVEVMRASIVYNRNNPSVIFYEGGNNGISEEHMAELKAIRDQYDPHGGRAIGSRDMLDSKVAEYGGEMLYINKSARIPFWAMEYSRDEGLRKYWDDFSPPYHKEGEGPLHKGEPAPAYNHNQDGHAIENVRRWFDYWQCRPGTGGRVSAGGANIIFSDTNSHHRGEVNYRASGEVDAMRIPKDGFFAHQVMWDGWVDVEKPRIHIIGHWNYKVGVRKSVHVVSGADEIELFLNGRSLGRNRNPEYRFLFSFSNIAWEPGVIEAVGYDSKGKESCRSKHETSGEPKALRLKSWTAPDGYGFKADGADHALVQVEVVDEEGRRVPTALNPIDFKIDGPAEWRGGIAMGPGNHILSKNLPVEGGVNRALLRARTSPGKVLISAASPGLAAATLELRAVSPPEGLPGSGLKPTLLRGPTPSTASFKTSRISVPVASTRSGSRNDTAKFACDDNEETTWSNEPGKDSAWIEFTLARQADLSEITAKLSGWRSRSYPLSISIDGREVFRGTTPTSLGYVTLKLLPSKGRVVRVQLVGKSESKDGFGTIKEVSNQSNAADGPSVGSGELGIVEIEFHEPSPTDVKN